MNNLFTDKKKWHIKIRFLIAAGIVWLPAMLCAQYSAEAIDSLENVLHTPNLSDNEVYQTYTQLTYACITVDNDKSLTYACEGMRWAEKRNNLFYSAQFYYYAGDIYTHLNNLDSALYYFEQSLAIQQQAYKKEAVHREELDLLKVQLLKNIGEIKYIYGIYDAAMEKYFNALEITGEIDKPNETASIYIKMANTYVALSNVVQAEAYYMKGEEIYRQLKDTTGLADVYMGLSDIYNFYKEDYPKAIEYARESYHLLTALPGVSAFSLVQSTQSLSDVLLKVADYDNALAYALQCVEYARQTNSPLYINSALYSLANCYLKKEQYKEAEETAFSALAIDSTMASANYNLYAIIAMSNIYLKNSSRAIEYFGKATNVIRALSNQRFQASLSEMEVKYETEKKALQITALEKEQRLMKWLSITGGSLLLVGLVALFLRWRWTVQKRRFAEQQYELAEVRRLQAEQQSQLAESRIRQLEQEKQLIATQAVLDGEVNERSRLASDLHDGLGSMLTGLKINLELMKGNTSPSLDEVKYYDNAMHILNDSMIEMRRVAHHLMPDVLSRYGLKAALTDFFNDIPLVAFTWFGNDNRLDNPQKEVMLYRIIHELVNNALKHARATAICVNVMRETEYIAFTVHDNGLGFDPAAEYKGMGLSNIRKRIASCDGRMEVHSKVGEGTEINVELTIDN